MGYITCLKILGNRTVNSSQPCSLTGHHRGPASRQPLNPEAAALSQAEDRWNGMCTGKFKICNLTWSKICLSGGVNAQNGHQDGISLLW